MTDALDHTATLRSIEACAEQLGHQIGRWPAHDQESIAFCARCPARIYVQFAPASPVADGESLDQVCPN